MNVEHYQQAKAPSQGQPVGYAQQQTVDRACKIGGTSMNGAAGTYRRLAQHDGYGDGCGNIQIGLRRHKQGHTCSTKLVLRVDMSACCEHVGIVTT